MINMRSVSKAVVATALAALSVGCGNAVRQGRSPVYLILNSVQGARGNDPGQFANPLISDVLTNVTSPAPCTTTSPCPTIFNDLGRADLTLGMKDVGTPGSATSPTSNNAVTIDRYHVEYRRTDGRNTPGVDVPYAFDGGVTVTVPSNSASTAVAFELVRHSAKREAPLVQLATNPGVINTIAYVTFYGHDQVGNEMSVTGSMYVDFGNFGDQ